MSLILEALNRADKDRRSDTHAPNIQSQTVINEEPIKSHTATITISLILFALLLAGAAYKLFQPEKVHNNTTVTDSTLIENPPPIATSQHALPKPSPAVNKLYKTTNERTEKATQEESKIVNQTPIITDEPKPNIINNTLPFLSELPWNTQKKIPTIDYNQHVFLDGGNSFVEINQKIYKDGDAIDNTLQLIKIEAETITLQIHTTRFRLNALNSWVNFN